MRARIAKQKVQVFKPEIDDRYSKCDVVSHAGEKHEAVSVGNAEEILSLVEEDTFVIAIDEAQFFDNKIVEVCIHLANQHKRVICAGLDMDFRGIPFGPMPQLMAVAEFVDKIQAICLVCGYPAS